MPDDTQIDLRQTVTELRQQLDARTAERDEALAREAAMAEVMQVINSSPSELAPVFDAMLARALSLCEATHGHIWRVEGHQAHAVALRGDAQFIESMRRESPTDLLSGRPLTRIARGEHVVRIPDATKEELYRTHDAYREFIDASGIRSGVMVALRKDEALLGAIVVHRKEVRPFTDKQIALLENFAAEAVIAMENARLLTETREALEQQTATAEVLQVINSSPGDLAPVFQAIVEKAHTLCGAVCGSLQLWDGEKFRGIAMRGFPEPMVEAVRQGYVPGPNHPCRGLIDGARIAHCSDMAAVDDPVTRLGAKLSGIRTVAFVALRKDEALLGQIVAGRLEVRPFTDAELALLENFAAQAVIAMENARFLTETREALEQQTATAEVLGVINSSPGDLAPVFDAMLEKAMRLCDANFGWMFTIDGDSPHIVAERDVPEAFVAYVTENSPGIGPDTFFGRGVLRRSIIHTADIRTADTYRSGQPLAKAAVDLGGVRAILMAPLVKDARALGVFAIFRTEVRPFSDKQIALLENFAAQAVIAMENARLLTETRERTRDLEEALEYQTATSDVLRVISRSIFDLQPVLDTLVESAARLCEAEIANIWRPKDGVYRVAASSRYKEYVNQKGYLETVTIEPSRATATGRALLEGRTVHVHDVQVDADYRPTGIAILGNYRTVLAVPLLREGVAIGVIALT